MPLTWALPCPQALPCPTRNRTFRAVLGHRSARDASWGHRSGRDRDLQKLKGRGDRHCRSSGWGRPRGPGGRNQDKPGRPECAIKIADRCPRYRVFNDPLSWRWRPGTRPRERNVPLSHWFRVARATAGRRSRRHAVGEGEGGEGRYLDAAVPGQGPAQGRRAPAPSCEKFTLAFVRCRHGYAWAVPVHLAAGVDAPVTLSQK